MFSITPCFFDNLAKAFAHGQSYYKNKFKTRLVKDRHSVYYDIFPSLFAMMRSAGRKNDSRK